MNGTRLIAVSLALMLLLTSAALAEGNWWNEIGPAASAQATPETTPEPTPASALTWENLFGGWTPDGTLEPGDDEEHTGDVLPDDYEGEDGLPYDDSEEGDYIEEGDGLLDEDDPNALFDQHVREITGQAFGNAVQCAMLSGDWTVTRGYFLDSYRVTAECLTGYGRQVMADAALMSSFVPAGDGIIYYGEATKGPLSWLFKRPGDAAPYALNLKDTDSVFYTDEDYIWYFSYGSGSTYPISRMGYDGKNKKQLGKLKGTIIGMMDDGSVLAALYSKDQVILWKDGKSKVVYEPKREILNVITTGRGIWVQHEQEFGLLEDGELRFRFPGVIRSVGCSADQLVFVVQRSPGAARFDVLMCNEPYRAWARLGDTKAQVNLNVELSPPDWVAVWGPEESQWLRTPAQGEWLPYGYFDRASAEAGEDKTVRPEDSAQTGERLTRRVSPEYLQMSNKEIMADAKDRGITVTHDRDGMYTYLEMTADQHSELLYDRSWALLGHLEALKGRGVISGYGCSDDFSVITLQVSWESVRDHMDVLMSDLAPVALLASAYQMLLYDTEEPVVIIQLNDQATDELLDTLHAPSAFLFG